MMPVTVEDKKYLEHIEENAEDEAYYTGHEQIEENIRGEDESEA
jgi:hypothetical protein